LTKLTTDSQCLICLWVRSNAKLTWIKKWHELNKITLVAIIPNYNPDMNSTTPVNMGTIKTINDYKPHQPTGWPKK